MLKKKLIPNFNECSKHVSYKGLITGVNDGGIMKGGFRSVFLVAIIAIVITRREGGGFWKLATPLYQLRINLDFNLDLVSCFNFLIFISFYNRMSFSIYISHDFTAREDMNSIN